jgi:hypothetical protein
MSKTTTKATQRTNFLTHEALIVQGETLTVQGWVDVALEAKTWKSVSEYAKVSAKSTTQHSANTIRQYASFVIAGIKRYGSAEKLLKAYDESYSYRSIVDLRSFISTSSTKSKRASRFSAKKVADKMKKQFSAEQIKAIKACL